MARRTTVHLPCSPSYQLRITLTDQPTHPGQTHLAIDSLLASAKDPGQAQRRFDATLDHALVERLASTLQQHLQG